MKSRSTMRARIAAAALAAVMTVGMGMPAWAAYGQQTTNGKVGSSGGQTFTYGSVRGGTTTFDKYLVTKQGGFAPNVTFNFTIEPGVAIAAAEGKMAVYAGNDGVTSNAAGTDGAGVPTIVAGAEFTSDEGFDDTESDAGDKTINFTTPEDDTDEYYISKSVTVDFSNVYFYEPGIYRWVITETPVTATGITNDTNTKRTLDVYVTGDENGTLKVEKYILHEGTEAPAANTEKGGSDGDAIDASETDKKSTGFTNYYDAYDIVFGKEVKGNQGQPDSVKYLV